MHSDAERMDLQADFGGTGSGDFVVDEGYLRRQAVQHDGRISLIDLTPRGRRYAAEVQKTFAAVAYEHFVAPLDADDLANMRRIWDKLCPADQGPTPASPPS